jgi:hypothetical protein
MRGCHSCTRKRPGDSSECVAQMGYPPKSLRCVASYALTAVRLALRALPSADESFALHPEQAGRCAPVSSADIHRVLHDGSPRRVELVPDADGKLRDRARDRAEAAAGARRCRRARGTRRLDEVEDSHAKGPRQRFEGRDGGTRPPCLDGEKNVGPKGPHLGELTEREAGGNAQLANASPNGGRESRRGAHPRIFSRGEASAYLQTSPPMRPPTTPGSSGFAGELTLAR